MKAVTFFKLTEADKVLRLSELGYYYAIVCGHLQHGRHIRRFRQLVTERWPNMEQQATRVEQFAMQRCNK